MKKQCKWRCWIYSLTVASALHAVSSETNPLDRFDLLDPQAAAALKLFSATRGINLNTIVGGRLTTQSGVPITTSDRVSQGTLYYTPYLGSKIALYDGSIWQLYNFTELSLSLAGVASGSNYDVWIYANSGTPTLELSAAWASDTNRTEGVWYQDGVYVKAADPTRRYMGIIRGTGAGVIEDSSTRRFVNNFYNRTERAFSKTDSTSHSYNGGMRRFNGDSTNVFEWVTSDIIQISACIQCTVTYTTGTSGSCGLGLDSDTIAYSYSDNQKASSTSKLTGAVFDTVVDGYHYLSILEGTQTAGAQTFTSVTARALLEQ